MELVFAFLDLKITQNKEKNPLFPFLCIVDWYKMGSKGQTAQPQRASKTQPQPLHPEINDLKFAVWGKLMLFVSSDSKQQKPVAPGVERNVQSGVLTLFGACPNYLY